LPGNSRPAGLTATDWRILRGMGGLARLAGCRLADAPAARDFSHWLADMPVAHA
jgi:hypothetical protein